MLTVSARDGQLQLRVGVNSGVDAFFHWSWSGISQFVGRVGAKLKWFGAELEWNFEIGGWSWSWSGVEMAWSGVGVDAFFQLRLNSY